MQARRQQCSHAVRGAAPAHRISLASWAMAQQGSTACSTTPLHADSEMLGFKCLRNRVRPTPPSTQHMPHADSTPQSSLRHTHAPQASALPGCRPPPDPRLRTPTDVRERGIELHTLGAAGRGAPVHAAAPPCGASGQSQLAASGEMTAGRACERSFCWLCWRMGGTRAGDTRARAGGARSRRAHRYARRSCRRRSMARRR